eukprot:gene30100-37587_t
MGWKKEKEKSAEKNFFNPEELTSQKREWAKQHRESVEEMQPDRLFEHFIVAGLPSSADVSSVTTSAKAAKGASLAAPGAGGAMGKGLVIAGVVGNNTTLYGVCVLVQEVVQRPP